jgi:hypothetical protein
MSDRIERRLKELGITLPQIQAPRANYVSVVVSGSLVYLSGQLPSLDGVLVKGSWAPSCAWTMTARPHGCARSTCSHIYKRLAAAILIEWSAASRSVVS